MQTESREWQLERQWNRRGKYKVGFPHHLDSVNLYRPSWKCRALQSRMQLQLITSFGKLVIWLKFCNKLTNQAYVLELEFKHR